MYVLTLAGSPCLGTVNTWFKMLPFTYLNWICDVTMDVRERLGMTSLTSIPATGEAGSESRNF